MGCSWGGVLGVDVGFGTIYEGSREMGEIIQCVFKSLGYDNGGPSNEESVISELGVVYSLCPSSNFDTRNVFGGVILFQLPSKSFCHDYVEKEGKGATLPQPSGNFEEVCWLPINQRSNPWLGNAG